MSVHWKPGNDIKGNSTNKHCSGKEGWMDVVSFDYGVSIQNQSAGMAGGFAKGAALASPISITKFSDAGSALLQQFAFEGENFSEMEFKVLQTTKGAEHEAVWIKLKNAHIDSFSLSASTDGGQPVENYTVLYQAIEVHLADQTQEGTKADKKEYNYNLAENIKGY